MQPRPTGNTVCPAPSRRRSMGGRYTPLASAARGRTVFPRLLLEPLLREERANLRPDRRDLDADNQDSGLDQKRAAPDFAVVGELAADPELVAFRVEVPDADRARGSGDRSRRAEV